MTPIDIQLPPGAVIANYLYPAMTLADLTQDILTVHLPNGYYIDVGWYPEHDPKGRYVIRVFREHWDQQKLDTPIMTRDQHQVRYFVESLAVRFSQPMITGSNTAATKMCMNRV